MKKLLLIPLLLFSLFSSAQKVDSAAIIQKLNSEAFARQRTLITLNDRIKVLDNAIAKTQKAFDSLIVASNQSNPTIERLKRQIDSLSNILYLNTPSNPAHPSIFGVNAHYLNIAEYSDTKKVTDIAQAAGINAVRVGMFTDQYGTLVSESKLKDVIFQIAGRDIDIYATLNTINIDKGYDAGYAVGNGFASKYGRLFKAIELGNEIELRSLNGTGDGSKLSHYDLSKLKVHGEYLRGMIEGIRAANPAIETIIDAGWLHAAYIAYLRDNGVKTSIVAWHWYYTMERAKPDFIEGYLARLFPGVKIIYNEVGYDLEDGKEYLAADYILRLMKTSDVFLYELTDQYTRTNPRESHFGLFDKFWNPKPLIKALKP